MTRHRSGPDDPYRFAEDNPNPALRPSVDHLIHQLKESSTLNRDQETQVYIIEKLVDWFFFRTAAASVMASEEAAWHGAISAIHRLALKLQQAWMVSVATRSKDWPRPQNLLPETWDVPMPDIKFSPTKAELKAAIVQHQLTSDEAYTLVCTCGKDCQSTEAFNKHQRIRIQKSLFPEE
jgi:hypothetical protein